MLAGRVLMGMGEGRLLVRKWVALKVQPWALEKED